MPARAPVGDRIAGALWGAAVGDALGVPVEFTSRRARLDDPVAGLRGYGTHHQPPGTWSDDSALLLCSAESLVECGGFDPAHLAATFVRWWREGHWSPHGEVFDIEAWNECRAMPADSPWASEWPHFESLAPDVLPGLDAAAIRGSGYSVHCLQAALWCVFQGGSFAEITLRAVNLGEDTDTTGCVAGAMAGLLLGADAVPERWARAIARRHEVADLVARFSAACSSHLARRPAGPP